MAAAAAVVSLEDRPLVDVLVSLDVVISAVEVVALVVVSALLVVSMLLGGASVVLLGGSVLLVVVSVLLGGASVLLLGGSVLLVVVSVLLAVVSLPPLELVSLPLPVPAAVLVEPTSVEGGAAMICAAARIVPRLSSFLILTVTLTLTS